MSSKIALKNLQDQEFSINHLDGAGAIAINSNDIVTKTSTSVTDNAIARYDGTAGKVQNSSVIIDDNGNLGVGSYPFAKLSTLGANNGIAENVFMAGILGVTNGFIVSKDSVANPNYKFLTANQATGLEIDSDGSVLLKAGTGALGYGTGAGGTVTQLTSKSTAVTLNKPSGIITTHNAALAAGAIVNFNLSNSLIKYNDVVNVELSAGSYTPAAYNIWTYCINGLASIYIKNISAVTLSESIPLNFSIIKGATA